MTTIATTAALPCNAVLLDEPLVTRDRLLAVEAEVTLGRCSDGFLHVEYAAGVDVLLFYHRSIHSALRFTASTGKPLSVAEFFREVNQAPAKRMRLCRTEVGVVLLAAVTFQNTPTLKLTAGVADLERILADVKTHGRDAALALIRGPEHNLAYCRNGTAVAVYFANAAAAPREPTVGEQILAYGYAAPAATTVEVFYDLQSQRDQHATLSFADLLAGRLGAAPFLLTVMRGGERVLRKLFQEGRASIGRDPVSDLVIDHLSISRHHCVIEWQRQSFIVRDAGSVNGTRLNGKKVDHATLRVGDRLTIGDFDVLFGGEGDGPQRELQTIFLEPEPEALGHAQLLVDGRPVKIPGTVFTIGKSPDAHLRLRGWRMKPIQATVVREVSGDYRLVGVAGGKPVHLNGKALDEGGSILASGDRVQIGKHKLVFVLTDVTQP